MDQIVVNQSPVAEMVTTLVRQVLLALGGMLASYGFVGQDQVPALAGSILTLITIGYGQYRAHHNAVVKAALANQLPDAVAVAK